MSFSAQTKVIRAIFTGCECNEVLAYDGFSLLVYLVYFNTATTEFLQKHSNSVIGV